MFLSKGDGGTAGCLDPPNKRYGRVQNRKGNSAAQPVRSSYLGEPADACAWACTAGLYKKMAQVTILRPCTYEVARDNRPTATGHRGNGVVADQEEGGILNVRHSQMRIWKGILSIGAQAFSVEETVDFAPHP